MDGFFVHMDASCSGLPDAPQHLEKRALSAARRPHEQQHLAAVHLERDSANGMYGRVFRTIGNGNIAQFGRQTGQFRPLVHSCVPYLNTLAVSTLNTFLIEINEAPTHIESVTMPKMTMSG